MSLNIQTAIETITPERAKELLETNTHNRRRSDLIVSRYTKVMAAGDWKLNGDAIRISNNNTLIDGQHRLAAIVASNTPIQSVVIYGLPPEVYETIDLGKARTMADALSVRGIKNAAHVAATARMLYHFKRVQEGAVLGAQDIGKTRMAWKEILNSLEENPDIEEFVAENMSQHRFVTRTVGQSCALALLYLFKQKDKALAEEYYNKLDRGVGLDQESTIYQLRERLVRNLSEQQKYTQLFRAVLVVKVWNSLRDGITNKHLLVHKQEHSLQIIK